MSADGTPAEGTRRIDRVLAEGYLAGLGEVPLADVRSLRDEAEQEEVDLSYIRRLIQGRMDIVRAELNRREGTGPGGTLVEGLARTLADEPRGPARGLGRHTTVEPSRVDSHRRYVEALVADVDLTDTGARSSDELHHAMRVLSEEEQVLSAKRREVQVVMDACSAEITRRYRDGEADVSSLLTADGEV
ncbi:MAG: AmfC protein [Frankiales bacterium]|nr:AmfC protein [Frankiales bacterium]